MPETGFPEGFLWGAATASYQIEGAVDADGRGRTIWDALCERPGAIENGDTGAVACDHYRRMPEDVELMASLGLTAYRFSIAWSRIQPDGTGAPLAAGLDFYDRLCDRLCAAGIRPWATLYHWDLPLALEQRGGWRDRDTAERFGEYAAHVHARIGDRVDRWMTVNEPWCSAFLGHAAGVHAPGLVEPAAAVRAVHTLLLAHARAAAAIRAASSASRVGIALNLAPCRPASQAPGDVDAARRIDGLMNRIFLAPVFRGTYPEDVLDDLRGVHDLAGDVRDGDMAAISAPLDHLGVNYYYAYALAGDGPGNAGPEWVAAGDVRFLPQPEPRTEMDWAVDAPGMVESLRQAHAYAGGIPLAITENGAAYPRSIEDEDRRAYLEAHVRACGDAIAEDLPLTAYLVWSLLDNFEWARGYGMRFGIVDVDFETLVRTPRRSARWLGKVARANGIPADFPA